MNAEEQEKYILFLVNRTPPSSAPIDDDDVDSDDIDSSSGIDDDSDEAPGVNPAHLSTPCAPAAAPGSPSSDAPTVSPPNSPVETVDTSAPAHFWTPAPCASSGFDSDETVSPDGIAPPVSDGEVEIVNVDMRGIPGWESDKKKEEEKRAQEKKVLRGRARMEARQRAIARARAEAAAGESSDDGSLPVHESQDAAKELPRSANASSKPRKSVGRRKTPKAIVKAGRHRGRVRAGDGATSDGEDCTGRRGSDVVITDEIEKAIGGTRRSSMKSRKVNISEAPVDDLRISSDDDDVVIRRAKPRRRVASSKPAVDDGKISSDVVIRKPRPGRIVATPKTAGNDMVVRSGDESPKLSRPRRRVAAPQPLVNDLHISSDDADQEVKRPKPRRRKPIGQVAGTGVKSKSAGNKKTSAAKKVSPIEEPAPEPMKRKTAFGARARVRV